MSIKYKYDISIIAPASIDSLEKESITKKIQEQSLGFDKIQLLFGESATEAVFAAEGEFVAFLHPGDSWENNAFKTAVSELRRHSDAGILVGDCSCLAAGDFFNMINRAAVRLYGWDSGYLPAGTPVVHGVSAVYRKQLLVEEKEVIRFASSEFQLANLLALNNTSCYYCREVIYLLHSDESPFYSQAYSLENCRVIAERSRELFNEVIPSAQSLLTLISGLLVIDNNRCTRSDRKSLKEILQLIDDYQIGYAPFLNRETKVFFLEVKHEPDSLPVRIWNRRCFVNNIPVFSFMDRNAFKIANIDIDSDEIIVYGKINVPLDPDSYRIIATDGIHEYEPVVFQLDKTSVRVYCRKVFYQERGLRFRFPLTASSISFKLVSAFTEEILRPEYQFVSKLNKFLDRSYYVSGREWIICKDPSGCSLVIQEYSTGKRWKHELQVWAELIRQRKLRTFIWRIIVFIATLIHSLDKYQIWLFMDHFVKGGDNAEELYKYYVEHKFKNVKTYFVMDKASPDYDRIKAYAENMLPYDSFKYKILVGVSDAIITSQTFFNTRNTFRTRTERLKELLHFKYIYLQHGVIKDNHADTQAHYKTALDLFITTAKAEYDSLMTEEYQLSPKIVKLTGLARYDQLVGMDKNKHGRKILIAPTWRKMATSLWNEDLQAYNYSESFRESEFYRFFNGLITDPRILEALEQYDYEIIIQLHPRMNEQRSLFSESERVHFDRSGKTLEESIGDTSLLITDYSSIVFDYAYARVASIYAQFDMKSFYSGHSYTRGYFDYEKDGFGPVCYDYETTVEAILDALKRDCELDDKYRKRIESFFDYYDGKNRQRIMEAIGELMGVTNGDQH